MNISSRMPLAVVVNAACYVHPPIGIPEINGDRNLEKRKTNKFQRR